MKKKVFIPMTLEEVGSSGELTSDSVLIKIILSTIASIIIASFICQKITLFLPEKINILLGLIIFIFTELYLIRVFAFSEKNLKEMFYNTKKNEITNVGEFSDVYKVLQNGICLHDSGHISVIIEVTRGTTIGRSREEIDSYKNCIKNFKDKVFQNKFSLKAINMESNDEKYELFRQQKINSIQMGFKNLEHNLNIKNTYLKSFMDYCMRDERDIYVVTSQFADLNTFIMKVEQMINSLKNPIILESKILKDEDSIRNLGNSFFDVQLFEIDKIDEEELDDILKFK